MNFPLHREMYERENRNLREARDMALSEKDRMQGTERETAAKYEQLLTEFRGLQATSEARVSEVQNELKVRKIIFFSLLNPQSC